jgi:hypothetical protein
MTHLAKAAALFLLLLAAWPLLGQAAVIYTYDFPGSSASNGLAINQTNGQPPNLTFSDFTRVGGLTTSGDSGAFGTKGWNLGGQDLTQYDTFSITSSGPTALITLTQISFDITVDANAPADYQVMLFLNGSATAYAVSPDYHLQGTSTTITFDFTDVTWADGATTADFKFYGWNTVSNGGHVVLDNVAISGGVAVVPEPSNLWAGVVGLVAAGGSLVRRRHRG